MNFMLSTLSIVASNFFCHGWYARQQAGNWIVFLGNNSGNNYINKSWPGCVTYTTRYRIDFSCASDLKRLPRVDKCSKCFLQIPPICLLINLRRSFMKRWSISIRYGIFYRLYQFDFFFNLQFDLHASHTPRIVYNFTLSPSYQPLREEGEMERMTSKPIRTWRFVT